MPGPHTPPIPVTALDPAAHPDHPEVARWQADIAAGRIAAPAPDPAIRANLLRTDALFRERARWIGSARA